MASPPYDVISTAEARALAADNVVSFLHVSRPEIDLPEGTDASVLGWWYPSSGVGVVNNDCMAVLAKAKNPVLAHLYINHLLDPATGTPAFTGIVQATALAPTALEAEIRAKAAVLSGPDSADRWLPHGGVVVFDDGRTQVV